MSPPVTILGIDPALTCTGYGLLRADGNRYEAIDFGAISPPPQAPSAERLLRIHQALSDVIRDSRPDDVAFAAFPVPCSVCHARAGAGARPGSPASPANAPPATPARLSSMSTALATSSTPPPAGSRGRKSPPRSLFPRVSSFARTR